MNALHARLTETLTAPHATVYATAAGVLSIDLRIVRDLLVELQADGPTTQFRDPAGIELLVAPGGTVSVGEPLARIRCDTGITDNMLARVGSSFRAEAELETATERRKARHSKERSASDSSVIVEVIRA
jgi:hypothetical protein